jgi:LysR family transcriptional regulator for metE and metH
MILNLRHLEMVQAIHQEGTLTGAARRLFLSQPALTRQLAKLESRIGTALFRRHPKGMDLTREGRRLLESAERVLFELQRAEHDVRLLAQGFAGALRVSTECYMCYHWLPRVAGVFGERFPRVEVQLVPEATRDPWGALQTAAVDVALVYSDAPHPPSIHRADVFRDEIVGIVSTDHRLAREPYLTPESFGSETLLCHYAEPGRGVLEREFLEPSGVRPHRTIEMPATPAVVEMARAGYGVAVVPRWILEGQGSLDRLAVLPLGEGGLWRTWYAACTAGRQDEPVLASLIRVLREELKWSGSAVEAPPERRIHVA